MTDQITLITKEDIKVTTSSDLRNISTYINIILEDWGSSEEISLELISYVGLQNVLGFAEHHNFQNYFVSIPQPLISADIADFLDPWHSEFFKSLSNESLFELITAANFLAIKPLVEISCAAIAAKIKGKTAEALRKEFNIESDFTQEEEAQIREESKWAENAISTYDFNKITI